MAELADEEAALTFRQTTIAAVSDHGHGYNTAGTKLVSQRLPTFAGNGRSDAWLDKLVQCFRAAHVPESDFLVNTLPLLELNSPAREPDQVAREMFHRNGAGAGAGAGWSTTPVTTAREGSAGNIARCCTATPTPSAGGR